MSLSQLAPLAAVKDATFYSLQKGPAAAQAATPPAGMNLIDLTGQIQDFADTAALMAHLDLVISVDTARFTWPAPSENQPGRCSPSTSIGAGSKTARTARGIRRCACSARKSRMNGEM